MYYNISKCYKLNKQWKNKKTRSCRNRRNMDLRGQIQGILYPF